MDNFFHDMAKKYSKRARYNILGENFVVLYNAEDIKQVLHTKNFIQKSAEYDGMLRIFRLKNCYANDIC